MTCSSCNIFGGYKYSSRKKPIGKGYRRVNTYRKSKKYNTSMNRRRMNSVGLSLARGRAYSGGNSAFSGFPTGYSTGGLLNPMLNSLANPPIIHPYNNCM